MTSDARWKAKAPGFDFSGKAGEHLQSRKGISQRNVAKKFEIYSELYLQKIREHVFAAEDPESFAKKRHIVRRPHFAKLDEAIHLCFIQE